MERSAKIYVAGHRGLVGSAILRALQGQGYTNLVVRTHAELDLTDAVATRAFFEEERPEYVFLAAAKVGGIMANNTYRADFLLDNLAIQQHVIGESLRTGVKKLLFLGSTCIYPKEAPQPMSEDCLLTSPLEYTNEPYAIAKIAGLKLCESMNLQYGTNFIAAMPTNLYGPGDNFDLERSHVLPAMLRKMLLARALSESDWAFIRRDLEVRPLLQLGALSEESNEAIAQVLDEHYGIKASELILWGSGRPRREFLWSEDMARACVFLMQQVNFSDLIPETGPVRNCHINVGTGEDISISELAHLIAYVVGYKGKISFDVTKPDGTMLKLTDPSRLHRMGWRHSVGLDAGIEQLHRWYLSSLEQ